MDDPMRAHQAQLLLDNPIFQEALEQVNRGINREMDSVRPNDVDTMKHLIMSRQVANRIVQHISSVANSAKVTEYNAINKRKRFF